MEEKRLKDLYNKAVGEFERTSIRNKLKKVQQELKQFDK